MSIQEATPIVLTAEERRRLEGWVRSSTTEQRLVERARVVLLAAAGMGSRAIARELGCARGVATQAMVLTAARDEKIGLVYPRGGGPVGPERGPVVKTILCSPPRRAECHLLARRWCSALSRRWCCRH
jgi:hypothetical protein